MGRKWYTIASREVGSDRRVRIPDDVRKVVAYETQNNREFVWWNYEKHSNYMVVSNEPLTKDNYEDVDYRIVYRDGEYEKIRPPDVKHGFPEVLLTHFYEGNELFYLIYEEMARDDDIRSSFLLTKSQVLQLLPEEAKEREGIDDDPDLTKKILDAPGFFPSL